MAHDSNHHGFGGVREFTLPGDIGGHTRQHPGRSNGGSALGRYGRTFRILRSLLQAASAQVSEGFGLSVSAVHEFNRNLAFN